MAQISSDNELELLRATGLTKAFAGVQALRDGHLRLRAGEIHALVGENGAGKSTLVRIISGALVPDGGELEIDGNRVDDFTPRGARQRGVSVIYQQPALFPELSVAENLALGLEESSLWRRVDHRQRRSRAVELLERVGARIDPSLPVRQLTMPEQQLVEIARALGRSARILILDEPTASLSEREVENLFAILRELRRAGIAVIYITHRMDEIFALADRITVLRDGETIATLPTTETDRQSLIRLMVGRELASVFPPRPATSREGETILRVEDLSSRALGLEGISFSLRAGEILGLAGLVGAGRSELARTLFGLHPLDRGRILVDRGGGAAGDPELQEVAITSPTAAIAAGVAYVPEDRRHHGVIPELSITVNSSLAVLPRLSSAGLIDRAAESSLAADFATRLQLRAPALYAPVATLSGGNQQKVALARWLATNPRILILDEPTQGIDVGAKGEIHRLMRELAGQGMGIIMISSELPEIIGMSDRIMVMRGGRAAATLTRGEATPERVISIALGHLPAD